MKNNINEKIEAAAFRRLIQHFKENPDIQNIDLMELAGFCRNCISKWYMEEAIENGVNIDYDKAKEIIYSMSYNEWKNRHQKEQPQDRIDKLSDKFHKH